MRTRGPVTRAKLSEETVKRLPVPPKGNRVSYFAGAIIQGAKAPRGFGVRVTAAGARSFVLNYPCAAANIASLSVLGQIGQRSKPYARRAICANALIVGRIRSRIVRPRLPQETSLQFLMISWLDMYAITANRCAAPMNTKARLTGS